MNSFLILRSEWACRENEAMVRELQRPAPGSKPLSFKNHYSTGLLSQVSP